MSVKERERTDSDPRVAQIRRGFGSGLEGPITKVRESGFGMTWWFVRTDLEGGGYWKRPEDVDAGAMIR